MTTATEQQTGTSVTAETAEAATRATDFWAQVQAVDLSNQCPEGVVFHHVKEGEVILGELSPMTRRLFVLFATEKTRALALQNTIAEKSSAHDALHVAADGDYGCKEHEAELSRLVREQGAVATRAVTINKMAWLALKVEFPEVEGIAFITEGWKVGHRPEEVMIRPSILVVGPNGVMNLGGAFPGDSVSGESTLDRFIRTFGFRG